MAQKIGIGADHAGKELKQLIIDFLRLEKYEVVDYGVSTPATSVDYPDYAGLLAHELSLHKIDRGILVCGTGIGMCITANKFPGVRAASVWDEFTARSSRQHNDANVICLGARTTNYHRAVDFTKIWLTTDYEGGRHQQRVSKIADIERKNFRLRDS